MAAAGYLLNKLNKNNLLEIKVGQFRNVITLFFLVDKLHVLLLTGVRKSLDNTCSL